MQITDAAHHVPATAPATPPMRFRNKAKGKPVNNGMSKNIVKGGASRSIHHVYQKTQVAASVRFPPLADILLLPIAVIANVAVSEDLAAVASEEARMIRRFIGATAVLGILVGAAPPRAEYAEGQVWEYQTRSGDKGSLLRIQKIEYLKALRPVYHISIIGVRFPGLPLASELQHIPVSRQSLDASVTRLSKSSAAFPEPSLGIAEWRAAEGGVFTVSIADVVSFVEQTVGQQIPR